VKVLIVEGDVTVAETLMFMLRAFEHDAFVARSLNQAISAARARPFDAYFIDMEYPDCGGLGVLGLLSRPESDRSKPRSVGWSGLPTVWHPAPATRLFDAIVAKPASLKTVMAALQGRTCPRCDKALDFEHLASHCRWAARASFIE
jgi:ActR/RegA family two-component response regulator